MAPPPPDADGDGVIDDEDAFPNDPAESMDTDQDGIGDNADPNPTEDLSNRLNSIHAGGHAEVKFITWYDKDGVEDTERIWDDELMTDCSASWDPQGTLCDEAPTTDSPDISTKSNGNSGAAWGADDPLSTGVLVVDACASGEFSEVEFNEGRAFQMFSDGKATSIRLYIHEARGDTAPAWNDAGWEALGGFRSVGPGSLDDEDALVVSEPSAFTVTPSITRYLKIELRNNGAYGDEGWIELRALKLFAMPRE